LNKDWQEFGNKNSLMKGNFYFAPVCYCLSETMAGRLQNAPQMNIFLVILYPQIPLADWDNF
jgi:hypothetical protein